METTERICELCGDPIDADQAWMTAGDGRELAHSGCVYRDEEPDRRERWMAPDA